MANIKDYAKTSIPKTNNEKLNKVNDDYGDLVNLFLSKYGEMDEDMLIQEMLQLIQKKKDEGTFDGEKIKELIKKVSPFLNNSQKEKMKQMMKYLD